MAVTYAGVFPGMQGFSTRNIWYMRDFYSTYYNKPKLQPLVTEISWTKNLIVMSCCKDSLAGGKA